MVASCGEYLELLWGDNTEVYRQVWVSWLALVCWCKVCVCLFVYGWWCWKGVSIRERSKTGKCVKAV